MNIECVDNEHSMQHQWEPPKAHTDTQTGKKKSTTSTITDTVDLKL